MTTANTNTGSGGVGSPGYFEELAGLARRLKALAEETPGLVRAADEALRAAEELAESRYAAAESEARREFLDASRRSEKSGENRRKALMARHAQTVEKARKKAEAEVEAFERETRRRAEEAAKELEQREWLADTMVESAEQKADAELGALRSAVGAKVRECEEAAAALREALARAGGALVENAPTDDATTMPLDRLHAVVLSEARSLSRLVNSSFISLVLAVSLGVAAALIAMVVLLILRRAWPGEVLAWAGVCGGVVGAALLLVRAVLRRLVPGRARRLGESMARLRRSAEAMVREGERACEAQKRAARERHARDMERIERKRAAWHEELCEREDRLLARLREVHAAHLESLESRHAADLRAVEEEASGALQSLAQERDRRVARAAAERDAALSAARAARATAVHELAARWGEMERLLRESHERVMAVTARVAPAWEDPRWARYPPVDTLPEGVPVARLTLDPRLMLASELPGDVAAALARAREFPVLLDLERRASLLVLHTPERRAEAIAALNQAMLRLVTSLPPGKVRFTILDPVGLGQSFAAFMHLADHDPQLVGDRIWTEARHIEQRLADLTEHMETVIQKYLRNQYETIQEYNAAAGELAEPLRFLVIADLPTNLTEPAGRRLASIIAAGGRCGVHVLLSGDARAKWPAYLPLVEVERHALTIEAKERVSVREASLSHWAARFEALPDDETLTMVLNRAGALAAHAARVEVPFSMASPSVEDRWSMSSAEEISIPIGRIGVNRLQRLVLGRGTAQHALVAGRTGSGKSTLFHVIVTNLALWYPPSEVELYLVDFKKGVEFKAYAAHALAHARVVAIESEREFGLSVLRRLDGELTRRGVLFRDAGVQDLSQYRRVAARSGGRLPVEMPRVLLLVDEFQEFFVDDDKIAQEAALLLDRLVRQGRAFGIHLILGSQTLGGAFSIARSTLGQMAVRIALQSSEQDCYLIMSEDNTAPRLLSRPGEAIYNDASGMVEGNSPFQVVWLPEDERERLLREVADLAASRGVRAPAPIVFEGNVPADVRTNRALAQVLREPAPASVPRAWLGDAVAIKDPTTVEFPRRGGSNVLVVGQDESAAAGMFAIGMLALAAQAGRAPAASIVLLCAPGEDEHAKCLEWASESLGALAERAGPREAAGVIGKLADEVSRRTAGSMDEHFAPVFLVLHGLQRMRDLRREDDFSFSRDEASASERLATVLREGPPVGVHTLIWCDSVTSLERAINRQGLREFAMRIVFQMSPTDSTHLIDSPVAGVLGRHRALLYRDETAGLEKFRPYAPPAEAWIRHAAARLGAKGRT
jgi:S-DNA-T family DNA segregation ATPase FtsK/SpoIIIE